MTGRELGLLQGAGIKYLRLLVSQRYRLEPEPELLVTLVAVVTAAVGTLSCEVCFDF